MTTTGIGSTPSTNTSSSSNSSSSNSSSANPYNLSPEDFINLMVTQLKNQDPTQPASSSDLLAQMSQIGQLESSTQLQTTMQSVTLQTQVGSASALIGKSVTGIDGSNNSVTGTVNSVSVAGGNVSLNLDSGDSMTLSQLSSVNATTATTSG
jgi:flagellar basal-body rod modification protein FlgD